MDASTALRRLVDVIDAQAWHELPDLLADDFSCHYVHTGESFDRDDWVRVNREYPDFQSFRLEDLVGQGDRAVSRGLVTGVSDGREQQFQVASFATVRDGLLTELVEVWTDVGQAPPAGRR